MEPDRADQSHIIASSASILTVPSCLFSPPISEWLTSRANTSPSDIVPVLKSSLRAKGLHVGRWQLQNQTITISDLREPGLDRHKYTFQMELGLATTGRGKWNELDMASYSSVNLANDEHLALSLKHQKPFYFSK